MASTRGELFAGVHVAIVTPFRGGEIDWDDLGKLVDWHIEQGTDGIGDDGVGPAGPHMEDHQRDALRCATLGWRDGAQGFSRPVMQQEIDSRTY